MKSVLSLVLDDGVFLPSNLLVLVAQNCAHFGPIWPLLVHAQKLFSVVRVSWSLCNTCIPTRMIGVRAPSCACSMSLLGRVSGSSYSSLCCNYRHQSGNQPEQTAGTFHGFPNSHGIGGASDPGACIIQHTPVVRLDVHAFCVGHVARKKRVL